VPETKVGKFHDLFGVTKRQSLLIRRKASNFIAFPGSSMLNSMPKREGVWSF